MAGNVWEWCATQSGKQYPYQLKDEWQETYLEANTDFRLVRGGSWYNEQQDVRGAYRSSNLQRDRTATIGLRVASHSPPPSWFLIAVC